MNRRAVDVAEHAVEGDNNEEESNSKNNNPKPLKEGEKENNKKKQQDPYKDGEVIAKGTARQGTIDVSEDRPEWIVGDWSVCSAKKCGSGVMTREVECGGSG